MLDSDQLLFTEGGDTEALAVLAEDLRTHCGNPEAIESVSIDMSPVYIKSVDEHIPNAEITIDKCHIITQASKAVDKTRSIEQNRDHLEDIVFWTRTRRQDRLFADKPFCGATNL